MRKGNKQKLYLLAGVSLLALGSVALAVAGTAAVFTVNRKTGAAEAGQVGLRQYFHCGNGAKDNPYVITRPIHFYNLSRLNALGAFDRERCYFQLGYDLDGDGDLEFYSSDDSKTTAETLDMSAYNGSTSYYSIYPIGNGAAPFRGYFEGMGKTVENLTIVSGPEDAGVFGYVSTGAIVQDVTFENVTVIDDGWSTDATIQTLASADTWSSDNGSLTYEGTVTQAPSGSTSSPYEANATSLMITSDLSGLIRMTAPSVPGYSYKFVCSSEYFTNTNADFLTSDPGATAVFKANETTDSGVDASTCISELAALKPGKILSTRFSILATKSLNYVHYSHIVSSYSVVFAKSGNGNISMRIVENSESGTSDSTFISQYSHGNNIGYVAGHVDGSLKNCFVKNGTLSMNRASNANTTKVAQETETGLVGEISPSIDKTTSPGWGAASENGNTGIVNFTDIYENVVGPSSFNASRSNSSFYQYTPVFNQSSATDEEKSYSRRWKSYLRTNGYADGDSSQEYLSDEPDSFSWAGQKLIQDGDTDDEDLGLGVFSLTSSRESSSTTTTFQNGISNFVVRKNRVEHLLTEPSVTVDENGRYSTTNTSTKFNEIFYETSELDEHDLYGSSYAKSHFADWKYNSANAEYNISQGVVLPQVKWNDWDNIQKPLDNKANFAEDKTWNKDFEKHTNFVFRFDLASDAAMDANSYFANPRNGFLEYYFRYKLKDDEGAGLDPLTSENLPNQNFGVFVKEQKNDEVVNIEQLYCSLDLNAPADGKILTYQTASDTSSALPQNAVNFQIDNPNGGNITVICEADEETGGYLSIYDKDQCVKTDSDSTIYFDANMPAYTTYVPGVNNLEGYDKDNFSYFDITYHAADSKVDGSSVTIPFTDVNRVATRVNNDKAKTPRLYAHTFFLPGPASGSSEPKKYFIASPSGTTRLYYVGVQGQNSGNLELNASVFSPNNVVKNVEFVKQTPSLSTDDSDKDDVTGTYSQTSLNQNILGLSFQAGFSNAEGLVYVNSDLSDGNSIPYISGNDVSGSDVSSIRTIILPKNMTSAIIQNNKYSSLSYAFNGETVTGHKYKRYPDQ